MTNAPTIYTIELKGDGSFDIPMYEKDIREFAEGRGTPLEIGGLVSISIKQGDKEPITMWQQITDIKKGTIYSVVTITDKNIELLGDCLIRIHNITPRPNHKVKEEERKRNEVVLSMIMLFSQLDNKNHTRKFMVDTNTIRNALLGDYEEITVEDLQAFSIETGLPIETE